MQANCVHSMKNNQLYLRIFNVLLTISAYGYLLYELVTFSDYAMFGQHFQSVAWKDYIFLFIALILMPVNVFFESVKWRELLRDLEPMTLVQAQKQVYYGFVGAFVTPYRAGDYPARSLMMKDPTKWPSAIGLGLVGTLAILLVEMIFGIPSAILFTCDKVVFPLTRVFVALVVLIVLLLVLPLIVRQLAKRQWKEEKLHQLFTTLANMHLPQFVRVIVWSAVRYMVWIMQASAVLAFCGVVLSPMEYIIALSTYYLAVAIFPTLPVADIAIRGSWAIIIFGAYSSNTAGIALAVIIIWVINTILPMLIGTIFRNSKSELTIKTI